MMKEMEMKKMGIKEIARQVEEIADKKLMGREGCVSFTDNEIVLCVKDEPEYHTTGVTFDVDTPRLILTAARNIINRMVFGLSPEEASAIITSTVPKVTVHQRKNQQFAYST
jgi:hypothetical protein